MAILVDSFTKQVRAEALPSKNAQEVCLFLWKNLYCEYGAPGECLVHDRGPELSEKVVKEMHEKFGTEIRLTNAGNKESNGQVERYIRTFKNRLSAAQSTYKDELLPVGWERYLVPAIVFGMNSSKSAAHGKVPLELTLGRQIYTPMDIERLDIDDSTGNWFSKELQLGSLRR